MSIEDQSPRSISLVATVPWIAASISAALGTSVLLGWTFDVPLMRNVLPGAVEIKLNTAIALCLSGCALLILDRTDHPTRLRVGVLLGVGLTLAGRARDSDSTGFAPRARSSVHSTNARFDAETS